jgi:hypothetical protein
MDKVPVRENWTEVVGQIVDWWPSPKSDSQLDIQIDVTSSADVQGFPNFLKEINGKRIVAHVQRIVAEKKSIAQNATIRCQIKFKGWPDKLFIHPHNFTIET